jgi:hypothetical protein
VADDLLSRGSGPRSTAQVGDVLAAAVAGV